MDGRTIGEGLASGDPSMIYLCIVLSKQIQLLK